MSQEIADLQKLAESKLKLKNPADLTSDPDTPMPEILAWALKLKSHNQRRPSRLLTVASPDQDTDGKPEKHRTERTRLQPANGHNDQRDVKRSNQNADYWPGPVRFARHPSDTTLFSST
jgi:hypothetical protein